VVVLQINKYSPALLKNSQPLRNDWFSFSHIGKERGGKVLSREEYLETEAKYLRAAHRFMAGASVANLRAHEVEHWDETDDALVALALDDIFDA
jgi:hypothetical protein